MPGLNPSLLRLSARRFARLLLAMLLLLALPGCAPRRDQPLETLRLGLPALEQNALVYIALQRGYFRDYGLQVEIHPYDIGAKAVTALLAGDVDIAGSAEFPVVRAALRGDPIRILTSIDKYEIAFLVARKASGIHNLADLAGCIQNDKTLSYCRIGAVTGTTNRFYLSRFLKLQGVPADQVRVVELNADQVVTAIREGQVDAVMTWQPYVYQIEQAGVDVQVWPAQSDQPANGVLSARQEWLAGHAPEVQSLLAALAEAESYLAGHPTQAQEIVRRQLGYNQEYLREVWPEHQFGLMLDYSLVVAMTDQARWLIAADPGAARSLPDLTHALYPDGLSAVKPEAVDINR